MGQQLLTRRLTVLLAASLLGAASCSFSSGSDGGGSGAKAGPRSSASILSVEYLQGDAETREVLKREELNLVATCMRAAGFEFQVAKATPTDGSEGLRLRWITSYDGGLQARRSEGFGAALPTPHVGEEDVPDPNRAYVQNLSQGQQAAFNRTLFGAGKKTGSVELGNGTEIGFPLDGCLAEARQDLYGDVERYTTAMSIVDNLLSLVQDQVVTDPRFEKASTSWQSCMDERGYQVETLGDLLNQVATSAPRVSGAPSEKEVSAAVADYECAKSANLIELQRSLGASATADITEKYGDAIDRYRRLRDKAFERLR